MTSAGELKVNATLLPLSQLTALLGAALCARSTERAVEQRAKRAGERQLSVVSERNEMLSKRKTTRE